MCGRFTLTASGEELADEFGLAETPALTPRYNIAPSQPVLVVSARRDRRVPAFMRWGIAFPPAKSGRKPPLLINARAETLGEQPAWKGALWQRRCLVPADGFYEWKQDGGRKQPWYVSRTDGRPFALAGLWQPPFGRDGETSCAIVTTAPVPPLDDLHDRMPLVVPPDERALWLDPEATREDVVRLLLSPGTVRDLRLHAVGTLVNNANNEDPACRAPLDAVPGPAQGRLFG
jgi:putative SOS response-associated peptidase YedK